MREAAHSRASFVCASSTQAVGRSPAKAAMGGTFSAGAKGTGGKRTTGSGGRPKSGDRYVFASSSQPVAQARSKRAASRVSQEAWDSFRQTGGSSSGKKSCSR